MNAEPGTRRMRLAPLLSWSLAQGAVAWWLLGAGGARLAAPPWNRPGTWAGWAEARSPIDVTFTSLRLLALAAVVYLLVITAMGLTCRLIGRDSWIQATDRASLGLVRRLLDGAVGIGFTASALGLAAVPTVVHLASASAQVQVAAPASEATMSAAPRYGSTATMLAMAAGPVPAGTATMSANVSPPLEPPPFSMGTATMTAPPVDREVVASGTEPSGTATMTAGGPVAVADPPSTATMTAPPAGGPDTTTAPAPVAAAAPTAGGTWTVAAGDHLWSIAERTITTEGSAPTQDEISAYWLEVIAANHEALVDPGCPDLIFIGQVITLPAR